MPRGIDHRSNPFRDLPQDDRTPRRGRGALRNSFESRSGGLSRFTESSTRPGRAHSEIEDLVLLRSDGHPLYNLSVVLDDIEMRSLTSYATDISQTTTDSLYQVLA